MEKIKIDQNELAVFDIGATHLRMGSIQNNAVANQIVVDTPQNFEDALNIVSKYIVDNNKKIIVAGIAGPMNREKTTLLDSNLTSWIGINIKDQIQNKTNAKVLLENDTALVGLAEAVYGEGINHSIVAYVTVSTGVNGVRIEDKKISKNWAGFEIGEQLIDGNISLEEKVGGLALEKKYNKLPTDIDDPTVWHQLELDLARGLSNTILHWSPEILIVGGGLSPKINIDNLNHEIEKLIGSFFSVPKITKGNLGEFGGLMGAHAFAMQNN